MTPGSPPRILRRYRASQVGSGVVPLRDDYARAVSFICTPRKRDGKSEMVPIGTGFVVGVPVPGKPPRTFWTYVITARHVVQGEPETYLRLRRKDGGIRHLRVADGWLEHPTADVAAMHPGDDLDDGDDLGVVPTEVFADQVLVRSGKTSDIHKALMLGDRVYFIGLLAMMKEMADANVPMVRSGTIGRLYQEKVPIKDKDGHVFPVLAHLIDCRSYNGFSGAPCFVQKDVNRMTGNLFTTGTETYLLGLVSAHFDMWTKTSERKGDKREYTGVDSPINSGVGIVTPVENIRELLDDEVFEDMRKKDLEEDEIKERQRAYDDAATPDALSHDEGTAQTKMDRFEDLGKKVFQVPKEEIDEKYESN